ncbi:Lsr2 protein [Curtobacterium sp. PhB146]|nr:Lsr2 protein [Curtobacterium sp. PhB146]
MHGHRLQLELVPSQTARKTWHVAELLGAHLVGQPPLRSGRGSGTTQRSNPDELAKIREWAAANGHDVAPRGRTSQAVKDAYNAAH